MGFPKSRHVPYIYNIYIYFLKLHGLSFRENIGRFLDPPLPIAIRSKLHGLSTDAAMQNSPVGDPMNLWVDLEMDAGITCNFARLQVLALVQLRWNCRSIILMLIFRIWRHESDPILKVMQKDISGDNYATCYQ